MSAADSTATSSSKTSASRPVYRFLVVGLATFVLGLTLFAAFKAVATPALPTIAVASMRPATRLAGTKATEPFNKSRLTMVALAATAFGLIGARSGASERTQVRRANTMGVDEVAKTTGLNIIGNVFPLESPTAAPPKLTKTRQPRWMVNFAEMVLALAILISIQSAATQPAIRQLFKRDPFAAYGAVVHDWAARARALTGLERQ